MNNYTSIIIPILEEIKRDYEKQGLIPTMELLIEDLKEEDGLRKQVELKLEANRLTSERD